MSDQASPATPSTERVIQGRRVIMSKGERAAYDAGYTEALQDAAAPELRQALTYIAKSPCHDFAPPATCETNDGTGLWCDPCMARHALAAAPAPREARQRIVKLSAALRPYRSDADPAVGAALDWADEYIAAAPAAVADARLPFRSRFNHNGPHMADEATGDTLLSEACPACRDLLANAPATAGTSEATR